MLKATLIAALMGTVSITAVATTAAAQTATENGVTDSAETPPDVEPDLETDPLTNRSDHEGFGRAFTDPVTTERVEGAGVYAQDDTRIGTISDLVVDAEGKVQDVIVDVGGVLGVGAKRVALKMDEVELVQAHDGDEVRAYVQKTEADLEALPDAEL